MSAFAFFGALELGLLYGLVALGVYLTFRVLDFPDLSVDGSFPMGAAVAATAIVAGINPWVATGLAILAGAATGWVTAFLSVRCGILHLLASILTMIAAFSINIRIMGRPNLALLGEDTILTPFEALGDPVLIRPLVVAVLVVISALLVIRLLNSDFGLGLRATGVNARMVAAQGASTAFYTYFCLALSNGFVGFAGGSICANQQFCGCHFWRWYNCGGACCGYFRTNPDPRSQDLGRCRGGHCRLCAVPFSGCLRTQFRHVWLTSVRS